MSRKAIFLDVDGTLATAAGEVPESARDAITAARRNGHLVFLCTGRSVAELWPDVLDIGYDGMITGDGTDVEVGTTVLHSIQLDPADVERATEYFAAHGTHVYLQARHGMYSTTAAQRYLARMIETAIPYPMRLQQLRGRAFSFVDRMRLDIEPLPQGVTKVVFLDSQAGFEEIRSEFAGEFDVLPSSVSFFGPRSGELLMKGTNKASGIQQILDHFTIDKADSIAIGDNYNDITMFSQVATAIAVKNAPAAVRNAATELAAQPEDDGIWHAFIRHSLV